MKTLCSLILLLFALVAHAAETNNGFQVISPRNSQPRVTLAGMMQDSLRARWDRNSQTYWFADKWGIGTQDGFSKGLFRGDPIALKRRITGPIVATFSWKQRTNNPNFNVRTATGGVTGGGESVFHLTLEGLF